MKLLKKNKKAGYSPGVVVLSFRGSEAIREISRFGGRSLTCVGDDSLGVIRLLRLRGLLEKVRRPHRHQECLRRYTCLRLRPAGLRLCSTLLRRP